MVRDGDRYVIGVDYGTLSGRAVVVRVSDGAELGTAVQEYPHGVVDTVLPGSGRRAPAGLGAAGARGLRRGAAHRRAGRPSRPPASTRPTSSASAPTSPPAPWCPRSPTARRCASADELRDEPHAYVKLWKHHAAQAQADRINELAAERGETWLARYGGLISSEWEFAKGLQMLEEAPEVYAAMEHWVEAADWIVWQLTETYVRNACTAGYKGIYQDGAYPSRDYLAALNPAFASFVDDKVEHEIGAARRRGRPPQRPGRRLDRPARGHRRRGRQRRRPRDGPRGGRRRPRPDGRHHGHLDLPRHDAPTCSPRCRACAASSTAASSPASAATRPGRAVSATSSAGSSRTRCPRPTQREARAAGIGVHEHLTALAAEQPIGAHGLVALDWRSGNRSVLVDHDLSGLDRRPDPRHPPRGRLPRPAGGHRVRHPDHRRDVRGVRRPGDRVRRRRRPAEERPAHADLRRRAEPAAVHRHLEPGPGPRLGDPRRGRRRRLPGRAHRGRGDGPPAAAASPPIAANVDAYDGLYAEYRVLHDHFGRGAERRHAHRLKAIRREAHA